MNLIGYIRTLSGLNALVIKESKNESETGHKKLEFAELPIQDVDIRANANPARLIESWEYLSDGCLPNEKTLFHIAVVLLETIPVFTSLKAPALPDARTPKSYQPTAAHPRAYKGTTHKPPKSSKTVLDDIQEHLCHQQSLKKILKMLAPYWPGALVLLEKSGYQTTALKAIDIETIDLYLAYHHPSYKKEPVEKIPEQFVKYILPNLKGLAWPIVAEFLSLYWNLSLNRKKGLLLAVARLTCQKPDDHILKWLHILAGQSPNRRLVFITLLVETELYRTDPPVNFENDMLRFDRQILKNNYAKYLTYLFESVKKGINLDYVFDGFLLAQKYYPDCKFYLPVYNCTDFSITTAENIHAYLKDDSDYWPHNLLGIWKGCGEYPGLSQIINRFGLTDYPPNISWKLLKIYLYSCVDDTDKLTKWKVISQISENEQLSKIPGDYHFNYLEILGYALYFWKTDEVRELLPYLRRLLTRLCRPPFNFNIQAAYVMLSLLALVGSKLRENFLSAPDSSFLNLEKACRSKNSATLIDWGIWDIFKGSNEYLGSARFPLDCFIFYPNKLFQTAKIFGSLIRHKRFFILRDFSRHAIMADNLTELPPAEVYNLIASHLVSVSNPFPKRLQQYINGEIDLTPGRIERYTEKMRSNLTLTQLELLEQLANTALENEYPVDSKSANWKHTMQILQRSFENRRPLRRYLKTWLRGDYDYMMRHHRTRAWLSKHSKVNLSLWLEGIERSRALDDLGKVTLAVEKNPEETLKMGSYVGSCLSLGGGFEFSAAAAVLDINKQVIYAQDDTGKVLARQLAAISDKDLLVFFEVYPTNVKPPLLEVFRDYDQEFARVLGLEIYKNENDEESYEIENIISQDWWDDGAWDFEISRE